jgi:hypothetical protein
MPTPRLGIDEGERMPGAKAMTATLCNALGNPF